MKYLNNRELLNQQNLTIWLCNSVTSIKTKYKTDFVVIILGYRLANH